MHHSTVIKYNTTSEHGSPQTLNVEEIKTLVTRTRILERIEFGGSDKLMTLIVSGKVKLYNLVAITDEKFNSSTGIYEGQSTTVDYVVQKNGQNHKIRKRQFKDDVSELFGDCIEVVQKVSKKEYKYFDMEAIVREYNDCND